MTFVTWTTVMTVGIGDLYSSSGFGRNSEVDVQGLLSISQLRLAWIWSNQDLPARRNKLVRKFNLVNSWLPILPPSAPQWNRTWSIEFLKSFLMMCISLKGTTGREVKSADYTLKPNLGDEILIPRFSHVNFWTQRVKLHRTTYPSFPILKLQNLKW